MKSIVTMNKGKEAKKFYTMNLPNVCSDEYLMTFRATVEIYS